MFLSTVACKKLEFRSVVPRFLERVLERLRKNGFQVKVSASTWTPQSELLVTQPQYWSNAQSSFDPVGGIEEAFLQAIILFKLSQLLSLVSWASAFFPYKSYDKVYGELDFFLPMSYFQIVFKLNYYKNMNRVTVKNFWMSLWEVGI